MGCSIADMTVRPIIPALQGHRAEATTKGELNMKPTRLLILGLSTATMFATALLPSSRMLGIPGSVGIAAAVKPSTAGLEKTYSKLPLSFEKNAGQSRA